MNDNESTTPIWNFSLYAGPILRRTESNRVCVWVATSAPVSVKGQIFLAEDMREFLMRPGAPLPPIYGEGNTESIPLGKRLHISLVQIKPRSQRPRLNSFPNGTLLGYDLEFIPKGSNQKVGRRLLDMDFGTDQGVSYPPYRFPTLFVAPFGPVNLLHGSCRKLHGQGADALAIADKILSDAVADPFKRPTALFLTGDQIYADEVSDVMIDHIIMLARHLLGFDERIPLQPNLSGSLRTTELRCGLRGRVLTNIITSDEDSRRNHLLGFGEFAAMYLLSWNKDNWPTDLPTMSQCQQRKTFPKKEIESLNVMRKALPAVRRALANVPCYMIFDDHEVTDDWNLTREWQQRARSSPLGKRLMANGLAAYWAFQGLGNHPDSFSADFKQAIVDSLKSADRTGGWEDTVLDFCDWGYVAPTNPPAVFMNTRTQRGFDSDKGPPRLLEAKALQRVIDESSNILRSKQVLILIAATPVFGVDTNELLQEQLLVPLFDSAKYDLESWHSNLDSYYSFLRAIRALKPRACVLLSGDVHYAFAIGAHLSSGNNETDFTPFTQFCSSALKNAPSVAVKVGRLGDADQRFKLWQHAVNTRMSTALKTKRVLTTPPVILSDWIADELGVIPPPDHIERTRKLGQDADPSNRMILTNSNLGQLLIEPNLKATLLFHTMNGVGGPPYAIKMSLDLQSPVVR